jgi:hypothetical protein
MEVSGKLRALFALLPGKQPSVPVQKEAGWALDPGWTLRRKEKSLGPAGIRTLVVQPVARRYTDLAIPTPILNMPIILMFWIIFGSFPVFPYLADIRSNDLMAAKVNKIFLGYQPTFQLLFLSHYMDLITSVYTIICLVGCVKYIYVYM